MASVKSRKHRESKRPARRSVRPAIEMLEDRLAPATYTWTGNGANDLWSNAANWDIGVPVSAADVVIPNVTGSVEVLFDASVPGSGVTLNSLTSSEPFHISGDTLTLDGPGTFQLNAHF